MTNLYVVFWSESLLIYRVTDLFLNFTLEMQRIELIFQVVLSSHYIVCDFYIYIYIHTNTHTHTHFSSPRGSQFNDLMFMYFAIFSYVMVIFTLCSCTFNLCKWYSAKRWLIFSPNSLSSYPVAIELCIALGFLQFGVFVCNVNWSSAKLLQVLTFKY